MLLLTLHSWFGPSRDCPPDKRHIMDVHERYEGWVTRKSLGDALLEMRERKWEYQKRYGSLTASEHRLISVVEIDDLTDDEIEAGGLYLIDGSAQRMRDDT